MKYVVLVHGEPGNYGASFPEAPGCTTGAGDLDSLLAKAPEALAFHLEGAAEDGDVPMPRGLEALRADPELGADFAGAVLVGLVDIAPPGRQVRVNISMPETVLGWIDRAADRAGKTRSSFLIDAAREHIVRQG